MGDLALKNNFTFDDSISYAAERLLEELDKGIDDWEKGRLIDEAQAYAELAR